MALAEAILVCLTDRPMSGYDLAKNFDASIGFFWRASHQQIYRELGRLRDKGHVASTEMAQSGKPNRIVHRITKDGRDYLYHWSQRPSRKPSVKDEMLVKLYALEAVDIDALREQITLRMDEHNGLAKQYQKIKSRFFENKELSVTEKGKLVALNIGIEQEQTNALWCEKMLDGLADIFRDEKVKRLHKK
ncbi:PadR family transcriptional regulator [Robiginitomaculum antarcticum]|uniref:PadR family transcriptional regulator n=1 Tax=Robiginitomaculum antarcticum TaxID=437507 RepID=UPI00035E553B|nr:PadR family transcriptional regulator [Robiginitomaculum antarcticum]